MTELEKKLLLSKEEFELLMKHFGFDAKTPSEPIVKQTNYYYDTDDLLMNQKNITCRIRFKDGKYKGTIKQHLPGSEHSTETDIEVYDGITKNTFIDMGLNLKGELLTERHIVLKDATCEVVLDRNTYLDHEDYELEIEYAPMCEQYAARILQTIINLLKINLPSQRIPSKSERFFERYSLTERR